MLGNETRGGGRGVPVSVGLLMMIQSHQLNSLLYQGISECLPAQRCHQKTHICDRQIRISGPPSAPTHSQTLQRTQMCVQKTHIRINVSWNRSIISFVSGFGEKENCFMGYMTVGHLASTVS